MACLAGIKDVEICFRNHSKSTHHRYDPEAGPKTIELFQEIIEILFDNPMALFTNGGFRNSMVRDRELGPKDEK